jgi:PAS domain S-box-containing protein
MNKAKVAAVRTRKANARRRRNGTNNMRGNDVNDGNGAVSDGAQPYQTAVVDLTERKKQEERLAEQARLLDLTHDAIIVRDLQDRIVYWNRGAEEMYGYKREEALGKITHELLRTEHPESLQSINQQLERDNSWSGELTHIRRDGKQITVLSRWSLDRDSRGRMTFVLQTNTDITKVKKTEAELRRSKEMLERLIQQRTKALRAANTELQTEISRRKGLEGQILEISDREQERLGQELHDGLCQQLTAIGFLARATALRLKDHRVVQTEDLEKIAQLINGSVMDARNIARDLHKEEIEAAEFVPALEDLVNRKIWKTPCRLDLKTDVNIEDDEVASQLYRILREAIINANKHARATQIILEVRRVKKELVFSVTDNGVGLSRKPKAGQGLGFHIMQYRAQSIGARLEFESPKKGGSRVACYLPLS